MYLYSGLDLGSVSDTPFFGHGVAIATHFGKVIRNCESLFVIYSHFCTLPKKFV